MLKVDREYRERMKMKKTEIKHIIILQLIIILYTVSSVMAKMASASESMEKLILFFALDLLFLGIYAICWQQMIKIFPLSVAYANRAAALLWSAVWAKIIFGEDISFRQMLAIVVVIIGMLIINTEKEA